MIRKSAILAVGAFLLAGCAESSVMEMSADTLQINTRGSEYCGMQGTQKAALNTAAIETIRHGYDSFIVLGAQGGSETHVAGYTPVTANTTGTVNSYGTMASYQGRTTYSGGDAILETTHGQNLMVKMFRSGEPGAEKALQARAVLGPEWEKMMAKDTRMMDCGR